MGDHLTSITLKDIAKLQEPRETYLDLLKFDEAEVEEKIRSSSPLAKVILTRLVPKQVFYDSPQKKHLLWESPEYEELVVAEKNLYALADLDRAMCLAIGRYAHNHFRPFAGDEQKDMDPFVSREHGLVFLNERKQVCYHDIGTFKKGSTNGTKLNDISVVKDKIIDWKQSDYFGFGDYLNMIRHCDRISESKFKLRYYSLE